MRLDQAASVIRKSSKAFAGVTGHNTFPGFSSIEAFICSECGESVMVGGSVQ